LLAAPLILQQVTCFMQFMVSHEPRWSAVIAISSSLHEKFPVVFIGPTKLELLQAP